jgi:hypothetical protein
LCSLSSLSFICFRLFTGWGVVVTGFAVPVWWSAPIVVIFADWRLVWREARG